MWGPVRVKYMLSHYVDGNTVSQRVLVPDVPRKKLETGEGQGSCFSLHLYPSPDITQSRNPHSGQEISMPPS